MGSTKQLTKVESGPPINSASVVYSDLVVMNFTRDPKQGFPIKSFHCHAGKQDMTETVELAKAYIQDQKLRHMGKGDEIPDLRLGRVCAIKGSDDTAIDYAFLTHKIGVTPTPDPTLASESVLAGSLDSIAKDNPL